MARRTITADGEDWHVYPSGGITPYERDEFTLVFETGSGPHRKRRVVRYAPRGARRPDASLAELSDAQLLELFQQSQTPWTSPHLAYARRDRRAAD